MRRAAKVDAVQADITRALQVSGWCVLSLAALGRGTPDLLCFHRGSSRMALVEVKTGGARTRWATARRQAAFAAVWPVTVLTSVEEALAWARRQGA